MFAIKDKKLSLGTEIHHFIKILTDNPLKYKLDCSVFIVLICME